MQNKKVESKPINFYSNKIYARNVKGRFNNIRVAMVFLTQLVFYGTLWLNWNDRQAVLFHLVEQKFYIFGFLFYPQDIIYLSIILMLSAYGLFLVTTVAGRIFCGYACPQTVYTEIFMWIENKVEGSRIKRMQLDKEPWNLKKIRIKVTKHAIWLLVSLWTGFTFVGYFTPVKELIHSSLTWSLGGWEIFWIFFYSGFAYLMAGFMREMVCKHMCPYARFQSVMFDPDTLIITYDEKRGEPRGARNKKIDHKQQGLGDCVDCGLCVQVCPAGIDIRKGFQYECIGCAACIDACDNVMDKLQYPKGLIHYSTENASKQNLSKQEMLKRVRRPSVVLYTVILFIIGLFSAHALMTRVPLRADIFKDRSVLSREAEEGIENVYVMKIMNATEREQTYDLSISGVEGIKILNNKAVHVGAGERKDVSLSIVVPRENKKGHYEITFDISSQKEKDITIQEKSTFLIN